MSVSPVQKKQELRRQIRERLEAMTEPQRATASEEARWRLETQPAWREANTVLLYAPMAKELDIWPLLEAALRTGKQAFLPRFERSKGNYIACCVVEPERDIQPGQFGIREPGQHCPEIPLNRLDLALVPGVAFDLHGRRLGRGKGFYDRLLAAVRGKTCGVAFDEQIVTEIPVEPHDVLLNCILTPSRWIQL